MLENYNLHFPQKFCDYPCEHLEIALWSIMKFQISLRIIVKMTGVFTCSSAKVESHHLFWTAANNCAYKDSISSSKASVKKAAINLFGEHGQSGCTFVSLIACHILQTTQISWYVLHRVQFVASRRTLILWHDWYNCMTTQQECLHCVWLPECEWKMLWIHTYVAMYFQTQICKS